MADANREETMLNILKSLEDSVKTLKEDNKSIVERLERVENPKEASGAVREHSAHESGSFANADEDIDTEVILGCEIAIFSRFSCQNRTNNKPARHKNRAYRTNVAFF